MSDGLAAAQALYGSGFPVRECLKALVVFAVGDLAALGDRDRRRLEHRPDKSAHQAVENRRKRCRK